MRSWTPPKSIEVSGHDGPTDPDACSLVSSKESPFQAKLPIEEAETALNPGSERHQVLEPASLLLGSNARGMASLASQYQHESLLVA